MGHASDGRAGGFGWEGEASAKVPSTVDVHADTMNVTSGDTNPRWFLF